SRADPDSAAPNEAAADFRLAAALRAAGGAAGEMLWQFPLAEHQFRAEPESVLQSWDRLHEDRAQEALVRQLVLTLRTWRPDVIVIDSPDEGAGLPVERLIAQAVRTAYAKAADPAAFPDLRKTLGLEPWQASKLYAVTTDMTTAQTLLDTNDACPRLEATARIFAASAAELLERAPARLPAQRGYRLFESRVTNSSGKGLLDGLNMSPAGICRRSLETVAPQPGLLKSIQARRNLETLASLPAGPLASPDALIGQVLPTLNQMPPDRAAEALFALADLDARLGRWRLAHELFTTFINRYPTAPHAVDAYRWLIQFAGSSEARRREELGERVGQASLEIKSTNSQHMITSGGMRPVGAIVKGGAEMIGNGAVGIVTDATARRKYYQECVALGDRLAGCGGLFAEDPATQFCLQAARQQVGDFETPHRWYQHVVNEHPAGPWHDAAAAELWLSARYGQPPKPVAFCRRLSERPYLDGELDDACWQNLKPVVLQNAAGTTAKAYPTEAWLTYDKDFLYLAVRCRRPAGQVVPLVKIRPRDADLRPYDRVSLMLDLDRDYSSFFHLQIDERGCVCDEFCQGAYHDLSWNPRWFVAVHSTATGWQAEAAIPMAELTGLPVTMGHAWACNVVRVIPGCGVQAWSTPAGVTPRPEGMGLLMFVGEDTKVRPGAETTGR
ncbi:MAG TPA: hypothetical protein VFA18_03710, partial [Gemmataceae bacterium]|nr:hypothetical protein [Gemmataceae bacterium]